MAASNLALDTKGLCFICISQVKALDPNNEVKSNTSFIQLLRYLKIKVCELNSLENSLSVYSSVDYENVILSLCQKCDIKIKSFSDLYTAWEEMGRKMNKFVEEIHNDLVISDTDPVKMDEYQTKMNGSKNWRDVFCENVVKDLRKEAIDKCAKVLNLAKSSTNETRSNIGSSVTYAPTRNYDQASQPKCDKSITPNVTPSLLPITRIDDNHADDNEQTASSSSGSTTSKDLRHQQQGQLQKDFIEKELRVSLERVSYLPDAHSDFGNENEDVDVLEENTVEMEEEVNILRNQEGIFSSSVFKNLLSEEANEVKNESENAISPPDNITTLAFAGQFCNKQFPSPKSAAIHASLQHRMVRRRHNEIGPKARSKKCWICSKIYRSKAALTAHMKSHTEG